MENNNNLNAVRPGFYHIGNYGGAERYVRYDLNAFAEMERLYGSMEAANEALTKGSMTDVRRILWLGLIHDQAVLDEITGEPIKYNLTVYEVGKWITPTNMKDIMNKLNSAIAGSVPEEELNKAGAGVTPAQAHEQAVASTQEDTAAQGEGASKVVPLKSPN